jgi:hypothetical protein
MIIGSYIVKNLEPNQKYQVRTNVLNFTKKFAVSSKSQKCRGLVKCCISKLRLDRDTKICSDNIGGQFEVEDFG